MDKGDLPINQFCCEDILLLAEISECVVNIVRSSMGPPSRRNAATANLSREGGKPLHGRQHKYPLLPSPAKHLPCPSPSIYVRWRTLSHGSCRLRARDQREPLAREYSPPPSGFELGLDALDSNRRTAGARRGARIIQATRSQTLPRRTSLQLARR